jgi:uncharacterized membrane protein YeaQ/YmgE (transglycosylase-associated protein family)
MVLGFICWNIVGLLLGFLADKLAHRPGDDPRPTLVAGAAGAALAGMLYGRLSAAGVEVFDRRSLIAAAVGALLVLAIWHKVRGHSIDR